MFVKRVIYDPKCTLKLGQFENVPLHSVATKGQCTELYFTLHSIHFGTLWTQLFDQDWRRNLFS